MSKNPASIRIKIHADKKQALICLLQARLNLYRIEGPRRLLRPGFWFLVFRYVHLRRRSSVCRFGWVTRSRKKNVARHQCRLSDGHAGAHRCRCGLEHK